QPANFLYPSITSPWEARLTPEDSLRFARKVDGLGFDQLWVSEHMIQVPELLGSMG
ncbi:MAG: LLM class flavin-dependent oxidoreductase, partial [Akkermansiaceae bacterium]|nr:LLM class flavin-dependent oxidoreductase [Akkermansiaceae bacterium]